jgi:iron complex outermembrane receptor protein
VPISNFSSDVKGRSERNPPRRASRPTLSLLLASSLLTAVGTPLARAQTSAAPPEAKGVLVADAAAAAAPESSGGAGQMEEVTVVGRHRAENKQDVPIPITAIGGKTLAEEHVDQLVDFKKIVPGFNLINSNPRVSAVVLRGVGGNASNDGSESGVGLIIDNVFYTHVGFAWLNLTDLDHVELLRGPQGTLLGKNTTVGALVVSTNKPSFDFGADAEMSFTNHNGYFFRGDATGALVPDVLAARLTVYADKSDGFILNHYNNNLYGDHNRYGIRGQLLYTPNDNIDDRLIFGHYQSYEYSNYVSTLGAGPQYFATLAAKVPRGATYTPIADATNFNEATQDRLPTHISGVSNEFNYHLDDGLTLTSVSAWEFFQFRPLNGAGNVPFPVSRSGYDVDTDQFSQEFRVASPTEGEFEWQGGLYGLREFIGTVDRTIYYQDAPAYYLGSLSNPNPVVSPALLNGVEEDKFGKADTTSIAAYLHGTWHITDQLDLTVGARDTLEWKYATDPSRYIGAEHSPNLAQTVYLLQNFGGLNGVADTSSGRIAVKNADGTYSFVPYHINGALSGTETHNSASFLVNPSYKIAPNILAYAAFSTGEKSGAAVTNAIAYTNGTGAVVPLFTKPETSVDFEFGLKTDWFDKRLEANINFYDDHIYNYQTAITQSLGVVGGIQQFASYLSTAGQVRLRGVELEGRVVPIEDLSVAFNAALNDARYVSFDNAPNPYFGITGNPTAATPFASLTGQQIPNAPRLSGNITINYQHALTDDLIGYIWVNQSYRSKVYFTSSYLRANYQTDYGLTDFGLGVKAADGSYSAEFFVKNALDLRYAVSINGVAAPTGATTGTLGDPRYIGGTLTYHFRGTSESTPEASTAYTPPPVQPVAPAPRSYLVFFDFDKSDLTADAAKVVDQAAANAAPAKATEITVTGHTDTAGSDAYNLRLSRRRAESVAARLEKDGISASEIAIVAKGKRDLLVPTADGLREPENRRVTIVYSGGAVS